MRAAVSACSKSPGGPLAPSCGPPRRSAEACAAGSPPLQKLAGHLHARREALLQVSATSDRGRKASMVYRYACFPSGGIARPSVVSQGSIRTSCQAGSLTVRYRSTPPAPRGLRAGCRRSPRRGLPPRASRETDRRRAPAGRSRSRPTSRPRGRSVHRRASMLCHSFPVPSAVRYGHGRDTTDTARHQGEDCPESPRRLGSGGGFQQRDRESARNIATEGVGLRLRAPPPRRR